MATSRIAMPSRQLANGFTAAVRASRSLTARKFTTEASIATTTPAAPSLDAEALSHDSTASQPRQTPETTSAPHLSKEAIRKTIPPRYEPPPNPFLTQIGCTLMSFPSMEPSGFVQYPSTHLGLPLRRDLLHRAVIYEADLTRHGTASTKWRNEIHGSGRKLRPQKGTGSARLGDRGSPMLRGGGVAFGPKPRDFSTKLPRKILDLAFRTALSYRHRMGELTVLNDVAEIGVEPGSAVRYLKELLDQSGMGRASGGALFVTTDERPQLFSAFAEDELSKYGRAMEVVDVDVKNLLERRRVVIESEALEWLLQEHESDVDPRHHIARVRRTEAKQQRAGQADAL